MEIFRLKAWTHYEPKKPKGAVGVLSAGFKTNKGEVMAMAAVGTLPDAEQITEEWLATSFHEEGVLQILLEHLTDEQRLELFAGFCLSCGSKNPQCPCMRDE